MMLGGIGPVGELPNDKAKIFASLYALFSDLVFIAIIAVLVAPPILHRFHVADEDFEFIGRAPICVGARG
jgi:hypothetical protein